VLAIAPGKAGKETSCPQCRYRLVVPFRSDPFVVELLAGIAPAQLPAAQLTAGEENTEAPIVLLDRPLRPPAGRDGEAERDALTRAARVPRQLYWALGGVGCATVGLLAWGLVAALQNVGPQTLPQHPVAVSSVTPTQREATPLPNAEPVKTPLPVKLSETPVPSFLAPLPDPAPLVIRPKPVAAPPEVVPPGQARAGVPGWDIALVKATPPSVPTSQIKNWLNWTHFVKGKVKAPAQRSDAQRAQSLKDVPEIALDLTGVSRDEVKYHSRAEFSTPPSDLGPLVPVAQWDRIRGLPLLMGGACRLSQTEGKGLAKAAFDVRGALSTRRLAKSQEPLNIGLVKEKLKKVAMDDATVRACVQIFPEGDQTLREFLVEMLTGHEGEFASHALARLAVADPCAKVRDQAGKALANRPHKEFQSVLVQFLKYPWQSGSARAAHLLVELKIKDAVPDIRQLLEEPDINLPRTVVIDRHPQQAVPQLARINHLKGCMICHSPVNPVTVNGLPRSGTFGRDFPVGSVPSPDGIVPPPFSPAYYYQQRSSDLMVRADITFLRQDFSVVQQVPKYGAWPTEQRFDFVARWLPVEEHQADQLCRTYQQNGISPQRQAALYVLEQLSGKETAAFLQELPRPQPSAIKGSGLLVQ
jgi:hypothetical protein